MGKPQFKFKESVIVELTRMRRHSSYPGKRLKISTYLKELSEVYIASLMRNVELLINQPEKYLLVHHDGTISGMLNNLFILEPEVRAYKVLESCIAFKMAGKPLYLAEYCRTESTKIH